MECLFKSLLVSIHLCFSWNQWAVLSCFSFFMVTIGFADNISLNYPVWSPSATCTDYIVHVFHTKADVCPEVLLSG